MSSNVLGVREFKIVFLFFLFEKRQILLSGKNKKIISNVVCWIPRKQDLI